MSAGVHLASDIAIPSVDEKCHEQIKGELKGLAATFDGFEQTLVQRRDKRRDDELKRTIAIKQSLTKLEENIQTESKRRNETAIALELMFNEKLNKMKIAVETPILAQFEVIDAKAENIKERIGKLEKKVEQDEVTFPKLIYERSQELIQQLTAFKARFAAEQKSSEHRETDLRNAISAAQVKVNDEFKTERFTRDQSIMRINGEIDGEIAVRRKENKMIKETMVNEFAMLKKAVEECNKERIRTTEEVLHALVHYAGALHESVNIASSI